MKHGNGTLLLGIGAVALGAVEAHGGSQLTPKVVLHVSAYTSKSNTICSSWSPNAKGIPCSNYVVDGPLGQNLIVYLVVAQVDTPLVGDGITGVTMGVEYNGNESEGLDVFGWTMCGDLEFRSPGPRGDWPASGAGNFVTWVECQGTRIGSDGLHTVVGAFSVYAYSADRLKITPNRTSSNGPWFALANCDYQEINPDSVSALGWAGFGVPGRNTCAPCSSPPVAVIDVAPNTLNAGSGGNYVTAHIELPPTYDPGEIDLASVRLNDQVSASPDFFELGDWNQNGVPDLMVKFSREAVDQFLPEGDQVTVTITGTIGDCTFAGTDLIRVIRPHLIHPNGGESYLAGARALVEWENPRGWTPDYAQIHYSADGGETWILVADSVIGQSYIWAVPQDPTQNGRLRVVLVDAEGVMGYDLSDGPFSVRAATTGVTESVPTAHRLYPNSPNPFQGATRAAFDLPEASNVSLKVVDLSGRVVRVLANGAYPAGNHAVRWDARDAAGHLVGGGIYFLHLEAGSFSDTKRMYLRK